jgi:hypothetical protein
MGSLAWKGFKYGDSGWIQIVSFCDEGDEYAGCIIVRMWNFVDQLEAVLSKNFV